MSGLNLALDTHFWAQGLCSRIFWTFGHPYFRLDLTTRCKKVSFPFHLLSLNLLPTQNSRRAELKLSVLKKEYFGIIKFLT